MGTFRLSSTCSITRTGAGLAAALFYLTIPHIFASPFYCYAYSFGNLLVLALYRKYQTEGAAFVPKYLDLLATGGSEPPATILRKVGVDMTSEAFWQSGFDTIREMIGQLESTLVEPFMHGYNALVEKARKSVEAR